VYRTALVAVENAAYAFDKLYTYLIPAELSGAAAGVRVLVPFGGGNRRRTGVIVELGEAAAREKLKPVLELLDDSPCLNEEGLMLLRFLREQTFCTWFDALRLLIPAGLGVVHKVVYAYGKVIAGSELTQTQREILAFLQGKKTPVESSKLCDAVGITPKDRELSALAETGAVLRTELSRQKIQDDKVRMVRLVELDRTPPYTPKQKLVIAFLEENESSSLKEIIYYTGATRAVVDALERKGAVEYYDAVHLRSPFQEDAPEESKPAALTEQQQTAYESLAAMTEEQKPAPALLYGVTGAGKTEVFLKLIEHVTAQGKSAIGLVPEISLTAQMVEGFRRRFGERVAVLHSALSLGERMDEWKRIRSGEAAIVIGTRSAVFAPVQNLGLIVIDEEQEHSYQSDKSPRFHARDIALRRAAWHGGLLLLSSATPSVESYYHAKRGRYRLITLTERYKKAALPDVYIIDMREKENVSAYAGYSNRLLDELHYNLEHKEQSILLLNRRGYSTVVKCGGCGVVAECPHCSVAMTFHSANNSLICHYCGYIRGTFTTCDYCGSELVRYAGTGTQKLEQELTALFPDARILRVDMDTTMAKFSHEKLFSAFAAHEYDIMVGTQMVAKGLNFPNVTLVGVLGADQALYAGDFRSYERAFSLLTQVVGRSGRGGKPGRAFIQTFSPEHPVIHLAARQDYPAFYEDEIGSRKLHLYPPFCAMAGIGFVGEELTQVQHWSARFLAQFREVAAARYPALPIRALGPSPSDVLKASGKYRYKLALKCRNTPETRALLHELLAWFYGACKTVSAYVDMHYDRL
jgi:primosomal protein N' (replication factor Y)